MTLRVLEPGLSTLVVDAGRPGYRSLGVPPGGAADRFALAIGNALVGNPPDAAALEITLAGPTVEAGCEVAAVVFGAPFQLSSDRQPLTAGTTFTLRPGETLRIGGTPHGMRAYLCIAGGIGVKPLLGSRSSLEPLSAATELPCLPGSISGRFVRINADGEYSWYPCFAQPRAVEVLRVLHGPQADWFSAGDFYGIDLARPPEFEVSAASNRMGLRLQGEPLKLPPRELLSEPVCPGAVQVTRDGQCIILGVDGQTIGGYPKIAQVISADLDRVGQLRPGSRVAFQRVELPEAEAVCREKKGALQGWLTRLQIATAG
jgi:biotin-dependent carboxylase-like uncharacterized protein